MARFRSPFQLVFPGIQQLPLQLQLTRQRLNVFTDLHSFHNLPLELHAVSTPLCHSGPSCHIASIRCKVRLFRVSHFRGSVHKKQRNTLKPALRSADLGEALCLTASTSPPTIISRTHWRNWRAPTASPWPISNKTATARSATRNGCVCCSAP